MKPDLTEVRRGAETSLKAQDADRGPIQYGKNFMTEPHSGDSGLSLRGLKSPVCLFRKKLSGAGFPECVKLPNADSIIRIRVRMFIQF